MPAVIRISRWRRRNAATRSATRRPARAKNSSGSAAPMANARVSAMVGQPDGAGCSRDDDGRQHRSRTRHIEHAQRKPESETATAGAELLLRKLGERLLQDRLEFREDQPDADRHQRDQREPSDGVLRQVQQRQQGRTRQGDNAETQYQAADHAVRPQPVRQRRLGLDCDAARRTGGVGTGALRTGEEDHRQHRKDARRDAGDQSTEEADQ